MNAKRWARSPLPRRGGEELFPKPAQRKPGLGGHDRHLPPKLSSHLLRLGILVWKVLQKRGRKRQC